MLLGWSRAILLQLAHPLVAAGVAEHSTFRGGPLTAVARLHHTVRAMLALTFGDAPARERTLDDNPRDPPPRPRPPCRTRSVDSRQERRTRPRIRRCCSGSTPRCSTPSCSSTTRSCLRSPPANATSTVRRRRASRLRSAPASEEVPRTQSALHRYIDDDARVGHDCGRRAGARTGGCRPCAAARVGDVAGGPRQSARDDRSSAVRRSRAVWVSVERGERERSLDAILRLIRVTRRALPRWPSA